MYAILLIFVVSINLVSSDVANAVQVQQLLERVNVLERKLEKVNLVERKLERVDVLEMKLATSFGVSGSLATMSSPCAKMLPAGLST